MMQRFILALLLFVFSAPAANALVLSCFPLKIEGPVKIDAYVDGYAQGTYPPKELGTIRILARFGEDIYEFFPEQAKEVSLRAGALVIHVVQPLSAGQTAEMRFEGKLAAKKGQPFEMSMFIRNERRSGKGSVRCTIE